MKIFEMLNRITQLDVDPDMPVVIKVNGERFYNRAEPTHVQVQRVCNQAQLLQPCDSARCETAFMALVIW